MEPGTVLAGKYRVERVLGQGGMGIVVKAMHLQLHQPVAMKFLLPEVLRIPQVVERFLREAQAAVRLKSEHVARVIDVGTLDTGAPFMVLEYLDGMDLSTFPRAQLSVGLIVDLMLQACEALGEAHSLGIVHRDVKPANFFVTRSSDGTLLLKVLDFGISKAASTAGALTATTSVMGTPAYMSPEQMRSSRNVDNRSDIWALGIVLYELLQGMPPFGGDTFSAMVLKVVNDPLPKLTVRLPGDLDRIIYRCLEKDASKRFQSVAELAQALSKYAQSTTQAAITIQRTRRMLGTEPPRAGTDPAHAADPLQTVPSTITGAAAAFTVSQSRARRWPIFAGGGLLTAVIVIAVVASSGDDKPAGARAASQGSTVQPPSASPTAPAPIVTPPTPPVVAPPATPVTAPPATPATAPPTPPPVTAPAVTATPTPTPPLTAPPTPTAPAVAIKPPPVAKKPPKKPPVKPPQPPPAGGEDVLGTRN